jgi:plasmid stabilization system protein ParE
VALEVVFRPQAEDDALEVRDWYESRRSGLGQEFRQELDTAIERIAAGPLVFPRVHGETRRAVLRRFRMPCTSAWLRLLSWCWPSMADNIHRAGSSDRRRFSRNGTRGLTRVAPDSR